MTPSLSRFCLLLACVAQDPAPPNKVATKPTQKDLQWPYLKHVRKSLARDNIPLLASKDARRAERARKLLVSYGPGVCPVLLGALTKRQKPDVAKELRSVLDELIEPAHAWPLTTAFGGKDTVRNRYVVERLASFKLKELAPFLRKAAKNADPEVAETATFALAGLGDASTLPFLFELAKNQWGEKNYPIREAAAALAGEDTTDWLMKKLIEKDLRTKVAALRLLGNAGTKDAVHAIATYLDAKEHQLRAGAVNALRGILDDEPPFRHLSVFQAIEEVKKWKLRLGR